MHSKADIAAELAWRDAEIDRLRAIVAKLPKTPVAPGMAVWILLRDRVTGTHVADWIYTDAAGSADAWYSTEEAALARYREKHGSNHVNV